MVGLYKPKRSKVIYWSIDFGTEQNAEKPKPEAPDPIGIRLFG